MCFEAGGPFKPRSSGLSGELDLCRVPHLRRALFAPRRWEAECCHPEPLPLFFPLPLLRPCPCCVLVLALAQSLPLLSPCSCCVLALAQSLFLLCPRACSVLALDVVLRGHPECNEGPPLTLAPFRTAPSFSTSNRFYLPPPPCRKADVLPSFIAVALALPP
jgi:hypothetical protein